MEEVIKENIDIVEMILQENKVDSDTIKNMGLLNKLNKNVKTKNPKYMRGRGNWTVSIMFSEPINSKKEFSKYLEDNNIRGYDPDNIENYTSIERYIFGDFRIKLGNVIAEFYNPSQ